MVRTSSTYGGQVHTRFWRENVKEKDRLEDPDVDVEDNIRINFQEI
jgi:hypothetical protein